MSEREKEIQKAAELAYSPSSGIMRSLTISIFKEGAEWADKTMIEKACEWLSDNMKCYAAFDWEMIKDFRKAMEE